MKYRTREGDMLDQVCLDYYQRSDVISQVLVVNPRLAGYGPVLPAGLVISLPKVTQPAAVHDVRLWD